MSLTTVMYHYVRDVAGTEFPELKALGVDAFRSQVDSLCERFEMATLETALAHLDHRYQPSRPLCLLTFDDGLEEHGHIVTEILAERRISGVFLIPTAPVQDGVVLPVHKNHMLLAHLGLERYQSELECALEETYPALDTSVDPERAARTYRWDSPEAAQFKFLVNYVLEEPVRNRILALIFIRVFGEELAFARKLYVGWEDVRRMQSAGMIVGGHTHSHPVLSSLSPERQRDEVTTSIGCLRQHARPQAFWPFAYPFGKRSTFDEATISALKSAEHSCAFTTEVGVAEPGTDPFAIPRFDTKDV